jgi:hypothetical protein
MKQYFATDGYWSDGTVWVEDLNKPMAPDNPKRLPLRLDLRNHSPTGFAWGYGGSGPAQLALALCADALGDDRTALLIYQQFKFRVMGRLDKDKGWSMTQDSILKELRDLLTTTGGRHAV